MELDNEAIKGVVCGIFGASKRIPNNNVSVVTVYLTSLRADRHSGLLTSRQGCLCTSGLAIYVNADEKGYLFKALL